MQVTPHARDKFCECKMILLSSRKRIANSAAIDAALTTAECSAPQDPAQHVTDSRVVCVVINSPGEWSEGKARVRPPSIAGKSVMQTPEECSDKADLSPQLV